MDTRLVAVVACIALVGACQVRPIDPDMIAETSLQAGGGTGGSMGGSMGGSTGSSTGGVTGSSTGGSTGSSTGGSTSTDGDAPPVVTCGDRIIDVGEACDDGNFEAGDGCLADCTLGPGGALPPVWSADYPASAFAMAEGVLVVGGDGRVELAPLTADGPAPWVVALPGERIADLALTPDGDIIVASEEVLSPYLIWLRRIGASGALLWSRDLPGLGWPRQVVVAPNDDIVLVTEGWPAALDVFDAAGVPRWSRTLPDEPSVRDVFGGVALDGVGRIHAVSRRQDSNVISSDLLRVEALTPQGELLWQVEHPLTGRIEDSHIVFTSTGTLLVVALEYLGVDLNAALLAEFDASGAMQWSRHDTSQYPEAGLSISRAVPAPGGGMFVDRWFGGDHDAWTAAARYDAAGAFLYGMRPRHGYITDSAVGPDGVFYSLQVDGDFTEARLLPHLP